MRNGFGGALRCLACSISIAGTWLAASNAAAADEVCRAAPCPVDAGSPLQDAALPELAGGARTPAAGPYWPLPLGAVKWSPRMDRHDLIIGALDAAHDDAYEYRLPYGEQVSYPVIQGYGARLSHRGVEQYTVDFGMPVGTPVYAGREGVVALAEDSHDAGCAREECGRLANFVVVLHSDGTTGEYFHLLHGSVQVRVGERVARGALLAFSGNTGYIDGPASALRRLSNRRRRPHAVSTRELRDARGPDPRAARGCALSEPAARRQLSRARAPEGRFCILRTMSRRALARIPTCVVRMPSAVLAAGLVLLAGCVSLPADDGAAPAPVAAAAPDPKAPRLAPLDTRTTSLAPGQELVGETQVLFARYENTFTAIGRRFDVGYEEMRAANPGIDQWLPGEATPIYLPTQSVLPDAPHVGHRDQRARDAPLLFHGRERRVGDREAARG